MSSRLVGSTQRQVVAKGVSVRDVAGGKLLGEVLLEGDGTRRVVGRQVPAGAVRPEHLAGQPHRQDHSSLPDDGKVASGEIGNRADLWSTEIRCSADGFAEG